MKEKLQIVQQMEELAGNIKRIEESLKECYSLMEEYADKLKDSP